jgi:hypothetical protein
MPCFAKLSSAFSASHSKSRRRRLKTELAEAAGRADALRAELAALDAAPAIRVESPTARGHGAPRSAAEKVKLFRLLFRGRDDVYPARFVSKKTGKPGYAPPCANKFVVGVCPLRSLGRGAAPRLRPSSTRSSRPRSSTR